MPRPLKVGVEITIAEAKGMPGTPGWNDIARSAKLAEDVGFDSVWVEDHLLFRDEDENPQGVWECWTMLAAVAAITERVEIGPLVSCTSFRNPALTAKMAATVDEISNGRLILGLGAGWNPPEYTAFGFPFDYRVSRFEEALTVISTLLREGEIDFEGKYYSARDCVLSPRGPRPEGIPILLGTVGDRMLGLTAEHADYWNVYFSKTANSPDGLPELNARVDAACEAAGRDPATLLRTAAVSLQLDGTSGGRLPYWPTTAFSGSAQQIADELQRYAEQRIDHIIVWPDPNTPDGIERFADVLALLDA